jgi:hypothetical protein
VVDFQARAAAANLPETAQFCAGFQIVFLGGAEMEKTQGHGARAVLDSGHQTSAPAKYDVRELDFTFNYHVITLPGGSDWGNPGAVLISQGEVEQKIFDLAYVAVRQFFRQPGPYATQFSNRDAGNTRHWGLVPQRFDNVVSRVAGAPGQGYQVAQFR